MCAKVSRNHYSSLSLKCIIMEISRQILLECSLGVLNLAPFSLGILILGQIVFPIRDHCKEGCVCMGKGTLEDLTNLSQSLFGRESCYWDEAGSKGCCSWSGLSRGHPALPKGDKYPERETVLLLTLGWLHPAVSAKAWTHELLDSVLGKTEPHTSPNKAGKQYLHEGEITPITQTQKKKCTFQNNCKYRITLVKTPSSKWPF